MKTILAETEAIRAKEMKVAFMAAKDYLREISMGCVKLNARRYWQVKTSK